MKMYAMIDPNERIGYSVWIILTDCSEDNLERLVGLSHDLAVEGANECKGIDLSACFSDDEYLAALLNAEGYSFEYKTATVCAW